MLEQLPVELIKNLFSPSTGKAFGNRTQNWDSVLILLEFCATYPFPATAASSFRVPACVLGAPVRACMYDTHMCMIHTCV